ncbi:protoporphyrinogen oxidase [Bacillus carboniphilus]|uniref:Coproporphyrinogen III oxidase n=1 Tax=Bacillus carboniphilus TaxID=86663 RepID=A0ABN0W4G3_9BACI
MSSPSKKIVIVGGGITGLSAAYYLKKNCKETSVDITIIEKSNDIGGKINTLHRDGFIIERGPESFLSRKQPVVTLTKELDLEEELVGTNPEAKANYILHKGKMHQMPLGFVLGIPTKLSPFLKTGLISPLGKIRAGFDFFIPKRSDIGDEALGHFIKRRLGSEVLHNITEPLLSGIYAGNTNYLSLNATFPQFKQLEQKHGSLIKGMLSGQKVHRTQTPQLPEIAQRSMFLTYRRGLSTLVERLKEAIQPTRLIMGQGVNSIQEHQNRYRVFLENGEEMDADGVILALPAIHVSNLIPEFSLNNTLKDIPYVSVANIVLAFNRDDIQYPLTGSGFVVPRKEGRFITACTWSSSKWSHTAPEGKVLLRTYVGHAGSQGWTSLTDEELVVGVRNDLEAIMGIQASPDFTVVTRHNQAMPQYLVGHVERITEVKEQLSRQKPGIYLCGAGYEGVGIPDCIEQGKKAADQMYSYLQTQ